MIKLHQFINKYRHLLPYLWVAVAFLASLAKIKVHRHNNYTIFRSSWGHLESGLSLYQAYPREYNDLYLYGPTFAVLIAPIAILPEAVSYLVWQMLLATLLLWAIASLPLSLERRALIGAFTLNEMVTGLMMQQWNVGIAALLILAFAFNERGREHWATLCIAIGLTTKLYGIVGLAFFPFAQHKWRFIWTLAMWTGLLLALPYICADANYVSGQYLEWFTTLASKNGINHFAAMQNISLLGIIRKWSGSAAYSDLIPITLGLLLYGLAYLRLGQYRHLGFRLGILSSTLLFVVLFSTGSESSSYVIAFPGIAIWYMLRQERTHLDLGLLIGAFILSSLSPTDIFPRALREQWVIPYALKALFPTLIWLRLSFELLFSDYAPTRPDTPSLQALHRMA